jgi:Uma2 family endonuclease
MATEQIQKPNEDFEPPRRIDVEEYLRLTETLPGKYEYAGGLIYPRFYPPGSHWAMAGGTRAHSRLITRMITALENHMSGGPCNVYTSDMRLVVGAADYFYPDAFVTCDEDMTPNRIDIRDARLVVEVRSDSTAEYDRGDKFVAYRALPGLREYVVLDTRKPQATVFRLGDDLEWRYITVVEGADLILHSVGLRMPLSNLYAGVPLDRNPAAR